MTARRAHDAPPHPAQARRHAPLEDAPHGADSGAPSRVAHPSGVRRRKHAPADPPKPSDQDRLCLLDRLEELGGTLLTREEEILLARLARDAVWEEGEEAGPACARDEASLAARNELVVRNIRLVVWLANKHLGRGLLLEDLVQEGTLGLIRAADKFDPESGNRFSTYATWWVKQAMGRALADKGRTIRLPVHFREKLHKMLTCRTSLADSLGREPEDEEVARYLKTHRGRGSGEGSAPPSWWTAERVTEVRRSSQITAVDSLDRPLASRHGPSDEEAALGILVPDGAGDADPLETACREEALARLGRALEELPERERRVLGERYGLDGGEPATLDAVAKELGMSRQGAQNLQARAEGRLRRSLTGPTVGRLGKGADVG